MEEKRAKGGREQDILRCNRAQKEYLQSIRKEWTKHLTELHLEHAGTRVKKKTDISKITSG